MPFDHTKTFPWFGSNIERLQRLTQLGDPEAAEALVREETRRGIIPQYVPPWLGNIVQEVREAIVGEQLHLGVRYRAENLLRARLEERQRRGDIGAYSVRVDYLAPHIVFHIQTELSPGRFFDWSVTLNSLDGG